MNKNNLNFEYNYSDLQTDSQSVIPAVISTVMMSIAEALTAMAEVLTIEEARQKQIDTADNTIMQKQLDYLNSQIEKLKKQINYHDH